MLAGTINYNYIQLFLLVAFIRVTRSSFESQSFQPFLDYLVTISIIVQADFDFKLSVNVRVSSQEKSLRFSFQSIMCSLCLG